MAKANIILDEQQLTKLEQIVIDRDEQGALKFLMEMRKSLKSLPNCDPIGLRTREKIQEIINKSRK